MSNFAQLYDRLARAVREDGPLTPGLAPRLGAAYDAIIARPFDTERVVGRVGELLEYLTSPEGRTHANCVAVDHLFGPTTDWAGDWDEAPEELADILGDMGGALHDTFHAPEIAENFDSTPEQLLARLRGFEHRYRAA